MIRRLLAVVVLALLATACGGGDDGGEPADGAADRTEIRIEFDGGEPTREIWRQDVSLGDTVSVIVTGDRDEQVHVHGYDLYVEPETSDTTLEFDALIPGRFEIEMEQSGRLLLEITVS
ncbi:MAG: hypothetical protein AAGA90_14100 [Actinomycetota bacterium]